MKTKIQDKFKWIKVFCIIYLLFVFLVAVIDLFRFGTLVNFGLFYLHAFGWGAVYIEDSAGLFWIWLLSIILLVSVVLLFCNKQKIIILPALLVVWDMHGEAIATNMPTPTRREPGSRMRSTTSPCLTAPSSAILRTALSGLPKIGTLSVQIHLGLWQ